MTTDETSGTNGSVTVTGKRSRKGGKRVRQPELTGMPKLDEIGRAARRFRKSIERFDDANTEKKGAHRALVKLMSEQERRSITIDGYTFKHQHEDAKDIIKVTRPKKKH